MTSFTRGLIQFSVLFSLYDRLCKFSLVYPLKLLEPFLLILLNLCLQIAQVVIDLLTTHLLLMHLLRLSLCNNLFTFPFSLNSLHLLLPSLELLLLFFLIDVTELFLFELSCNSLSLLVSFLGKCHQLKLWYLLLRRKSFQIINLSLFFSFTLLNLSQQFFFVSISHIFGGWFIQLGFTW